jgi:hypothetical protein
VVGDWESRDTVAGEHNEMALEEDGDGEATLYFYYDGEPFKADFDLEWEETDNGDIEIEFKCDGDCGSLDFTMECELNDDETEMDCEGDEMWDSYEFEWDREN